MRTLPLAYSNLVAQTQSMMDPALNQWLKECFSKQCDPDEMVEALIASGRPLDLASVIVSMGLHGRFFSTGMDERYAGRSAMGTPDVPEAREHMIDLGDRIVQKRMTLTSLSCVLYDNFLSDEECEHIKKQSHSRMTRSAVVGKNFSSVETRIRSSSGTFFDRAEDEIISAIENRVARLTGIPVNHGEGIQILHYTYAQEYQPHFDFFEPQNEEEAKMLQEPGNRVETLIFYLNDPEEGGATYFPQIKLSIHPKKGSVVRFCYLGSDGIPDRRSEHAGLPLIKGEKWIATKWLRQRPFTPPPVRSWANRDQSLPGAGTQQGHTQRSSADVVPIGSPRSPPAPHSESSSTDP